MKPRLVVALVAAIVLVGGGATAWVASRVDLSASGIFAAAHRHHEEAREFGRKATVEVCLKEALDRSDRCGRLATGCMTAVSIFARACVAEAEDSPAVCEGVAHPHRVLASARWTDGWCAEGGRENEPACEAIARTVQLHCHPR